MKKDHISILIGISLSTLFLTHNFVSAESFLNEVLIGLAYAAIWCVGAYSIFMCGVEMFYVLNKKNLQIKYRNPEKNEGKRYVFSAIMLLSAAMLISEYFNWNLLAIAISVMALRFLVAALFIKIKSHTLIINYH